MHPLVTTLGRRRCSCFAPLVPPFRGRRSFPESIHSLRNNWNEREMSGNLKSGKAFLIFKNLGQSRPHFFFIFVFSIQFLVQLIVNKTCILMDSNWGSVVSESTALPTDPQPVKYFLYFRPRFSFFVFGFG